MNKSSKAPKTGHGTLSGIIGNYYGAYESKDRAVMEGLLSNDFTFSSPRDDHISRTAYFEKCWPEADKIERFNVDKVIGDEDEAFARYHCLTTSGRSFRNTEYFKLRNGKIREIEVFFGTGQGFASNGD
jgi:ketosteroid isomerase-like protein